MKHLSRILSLLVLVSAALVLTNCGKDDPDPEPTPAEQQLALLVGTWKISAAKFEGDSKTEFVNSTVTITSGSTFTFTAASTIAAGPWPSSGSFEFGTNVLSQLTITHPNSDNIPTEYSVSASALTIKFKDYNGESYAHNGRVAVVEGDWEFTFTKQ